jgi:HEAT repeat protein
VVLLDDRRAVPALVQALTDKNDFIRASAADALGSLGDSQVVKALTGVLNDPDPSVQSSAQHALQKLGVQYNQGDPNG